MPGLGNSHGRAVLPRPPQKRPTLSGLGAVQGESAAPTQRVDEQKRLTLPYFGPPPSSSAAESDGHWGASLYGMFSDDLRTESLPPPVLERELPSHWFARSPEPAKRERAQASASGDTSLLEVGAVVDKYRIEELLGMGGFAAVYRATHLLLRNEVAIKMLRPNVVRQKPGLAASLCEEARFAARINHPNVVRVFDVTHTPRLTYVVMEYVEGEALAKTIKRDGALPPSVVIGIGLDVAAGLEAGLAQNVLHRDIKPGNIIVSGSGSAKIVDLGLAHPSSPEPDRVRAGRRSIVGTHGYMAPEVARGEQVDFRADIYSLGVTLYHAAVGRLPCAELDAEARFENAGPLADLISWMLAESPGRRPESYAVLTHALGRTRDKLDSSHTEPRTMDRR